MITDKKEASKLHSEAILLYRCILQSIFRFLSWALEGTDRRSVPFFVPSPFTFRRLRIQANAARKGANGQHRDNSDISKRGRSHRTAP